MSRPSVSGPLTAKLSAAATAPGYLIEVAFSTTYRWSSRGTLTWNSLTWTGLPFVVSLSSDGAGGQKLSLSFPNHDNAIGTLLLTDDIANRSVTLWTFTGDSPAAGDVVQVFSGVGDGYQLDMRSAKIDCVPIGQDIVKVPSARIVRNSIRQRLIEPGKRIAWGNEIYELEPR